MSDRETVGAIIEAYAQPGADELVELGTRVGHIYTDHGLPIDMAMDRLPHTKQQIILVLHGALSWLIEHRRNSGATGKAIERQRKTNGETMERFLATGESGIY